MGERLKIRVTKHEDNTVRFELMDGQTKLRDVSYVDILEMIMQFISCLRWDEVK